MARKRAATPAGAFNATLRTPLEHIADPVWLGHHSVLATPYCLGAHLQGAPSAASPQARGRLLQSLISESARELWSGPMPSTAGGLL